MTNLAWDRVKGAMSYDINGLGYNYRLDDMRAAIGIVQFDDYKIYRVPSAGC